MTGSSTIPFHRNEITNFKIDTKNTSNIKKMRMCQPFVSHLINPSLLIDQTRTRCAGQSRPDRTIRISTSFLFPSSTITIKAGPPFLPFLPFFLFPWRTRDNHYIGWSVATRSLIPPPYHPRFSIVYRHQ